MGIQQTSRPKELDWFAGLSAASLAIGFAAKVAENAVVYGHTRPLSDGWMPLTVLVTLMMVWLIWRVWARRSTSARTALAVIACMIVPQALIGLPTAFSSALAIGLASLFALVAQATGVLLAFHRNANAWFAGAAVTS